MPTLVVEHLTKSYPTPREPLVVLNDVSFSLDAGESLAVVGPSGSGKSTLLAIIGALDRPTSGTVSINGQDPFAINQKQLPAFRGEQIGFVFQDHYLLPQCTVLENVLAPLLAVGAAGRSEQDHARELLERVGLGDRLTHRPAELSGGERQRAAIARALVRQPKLVLADEPTGNLDGPTAARITELLLELQREQKSTLIAVTHSTELAAKLGSQLRLENGKLV